MCLGFAAAGCRAGMAHWRRFADLAKFWGYRHGSRVPCRGMGSGSVNFAGYWPGPGPLNTITRDGHCQTQLGYYSSAMTTVGANGKGLVAREGYCKLWLTSCQYKLKLRGAYLGWPLATQAKVSNCNVVNYGQLLARDFPLQATVS